MTTSRERIFQTLRRGLNGGPADAARQEAVNARIAGPKRNLVPARAQLPPPEQVELFVKKVTDLAVTVDRLRSANDVPAALSDYLAQRNLPMKVKISPDPNLQSLPWSERPLLEVEAGRGQAGDFVSLTPAFAAIAETGTLMLRSSPETPTTLHFVPDYHVVVLKSSQITGTLEDAFDRLRAAIGGAANWPRTVNFVTGPSRTADIEGVPVLGAHGPRQLHILLIDDAAQA